MFSKSRPTNRVAVWEDRRVPEVHNSGSRWLAGFPKKRALCVMSISRINSVSVGNR